jgi:hypothetical protein
MGTARTEWSARMDCPHATAPGVRWRVTVLGEPSGIMSNESGLQGHALWVPTLNTWTLDTLRMVLHELSAFLPAHEHAMVAIEAKQIQRGPRSRMPRPPKVDHVSLSVSARGWTALVYTWINERRTTPPTPAVESEGEWSEPMAAALLDLARKSPLPLSDITRVLAADDPTLRPSRLLSALDRTPRQRGSRDRYDRALQLYREFYRAIRSLESAEFREFQQVFKDVLPDPDGDD